MVMNFTEPYLLAMREQAPKMYMELRRHGRLDQHLKMKSHEAQAMFESLLARPSIEESGFYIRRRQIFRGRPIRFGGYGSKRRAGTRPFQWSPIS